MAANALNSVLYAKRRPKTVKSASEGPKVAKVRLLRENFGLRNRLVLDTATPDGKDDPSRCIAGRCRTSRPIPEPYGVHYMPNVIIPQDATEGEIAQAVVAWTSAHNRFLLLAIGQMKSNEEYEANVWFSTKDHAAERLILLDASLQRSNLPYNLQERAPEVEQR